MTRHVAWLNFIVSVWVLIAICAYGIGRNALSIPQLDEMYGPFSARAALAPAIVGGLELFFWLRIYRQPGTGGRIMAACMAVMLILFALLVPLLVGDLYGTDTDNGMLLIYLYIVLSHLAFAVLGRQRWHDRG